MKTFVCGFEGEKTRGMRLLVSVYWKKKKKKKLQGCYFESFVSANCLIGPFGFKHKMTVVLVPF